MNDNRKWLSITVENDNYHNQTNHLNHLVETLKDHIEYSVMDYDKISIDNFHYIRLLIMICSLFCALTIIAFNLPYIVLDKEVLNNCKYLFVRFITVMNPTLVLCLDEYEDLYSLIIVILENLNVKISSYNISIDALTVLILYQFCLKVQYIPH